MIYRRETKRGATPYGSALLFLLVWARARLVDCRYPRRITAPLHDPARLELSDADEALVRLAQGGDRDALESLLRGHYEGILSVCRRMTGNDTDAADAAQDALVAVARGMTRFDGRSRFSTWCYRIAVNCSIDEIRRRRRRDAVSLDEGPDHAVSLSRAGDPDQVADRVDIDAALRMLPPDFRAVVVLRDLCGLDYAEIAAVLEIPPGTVRSRIARGRAALVRFLEPIGSEP